MVLHYAIALVLLSLDIRNWAALPAMMRRPLIIDGRRLLPEAELRALGYTVERIGDGVDGDWESAAAD